MHKKILVGKGGYNNKYYAVFAGSNKTIAVNQKTKADVLRILKNKGYSHYTNTTYGKEDISLKEPKKKALKTHISNKLGIPNEADMRRMLGI